MFKPILITVIFWASIAIGYEGERHDLQRQSIQRENLQRENLQRDVLRQESNANAGEPQNNNVKNPPPKSQMMFHIPN